MVALARRSCTWRSATLSVYWRLAQSVQRHDSKPSSGRLYAGRSGHVLRSLACKWRVDVLQGRWIQDPWTSCQQFFRRDWFWFQYINLHPGIYNCCSCMLLPTCYIWGDVHFQGRIPGRWARALRLAGNSLVQLNLWFNSFGSCKYLGRQSFIKNVFDKIKKMWNMKIKIMKYIILYYIIL